MLAPMQMPAAPRPRFRRASSQTPKRSSSSSRRCGVLWTGRWLRRKAAGSRPSSKRSSSSSSLRPCKGRRLPRPRTAPPPPPWAIRKRLGPRLRTPERRLRPLGPRRGPQQPASGRPHSCGLATFCRVQARAQLRGAGDAAGEVPGAFSEAGPGGGPADDVEEAGAAQEARAGDREGEVRRGGGGGGGGGGGAEVRRGEEQQRPRRRVTRVTGNGTRDARWERQRRVTTATRETREAHTKKTYCYDGVRCVCRVREN